MKNLSVWDLSALLKSESDSFLEKERKLIEKENYRFINKWKKRDDYLKDPKVLKKALDEYEKIERFYGSNGNQGYYFWLRSSQDESDTRIKGVNNKIREFSSKIENDILFFRHRLAKVDKKIQKKFLSSKELKDYHHFLESIFNEAKYLLSEEEEKVLNLKTTPAYSNWVKMLSSFLSKEEREVLNEKGKKESRSFGEIMSLFSDRNKKIRDSASLAFNDILEKHSDTAEAEINSILLNKKIDDGLRKIERPDLTRHISDDIDSKSVDMLVEAVVNRFDIPQKYYKLKAKLMGVKKLEYHERNVPYGSLDKKYTYSQATDLVHKSLGKLDKQFSDIFSSFSKNGQIDVFPRKGKNSGAFCIGYLMSQPTYILLNHTNQLRDVLTLAHELGHGINNELIKEKQNALNFGTPMSTAEVASTFMEDFVLEELASDSDDELKLALNMMKLNDDISSIFRQIACYRFEQDLHKYFREKGYLSKKEIGQIFRKNMEAYMGSGIKQSSGSENWWIYWSHIRRFFYVYSYSSGLLISKYMQGRVKEDSSFIDKVKEFLSAGTSDSPKNIFKKMEIDISDKEFWKKGILEVENLLKETEKLAKKMGKI